MAEQIPDDWKQAVLEILEEGDPERIEIKETSARIPFQDMFPGAFLYEMFAAFADGLSDDEIEGRQIHDMDEEGITWAFIFRHRQKGSMGRFV